MLLWGALITHTQHHHTTLELATTESCFPPPHTDPGRFSHPRAWRTWGDTHKQARCQHHHTCAGSPRCRGYTSLGRKHMSLSQVLPALLKDGVQFHPPSEHPTRLPDVPLSWRALWDWKSEELSRGAELPIIMNDGTTPKLQTLQQLIDLCDSVQKIHQFWFSSNAHSSGVSSYVS